MNRSTVGRLFVDHDPTPAELELIRLCLSTFQDGSGMLKDGLQTLPGWRDFERTIAELVKGAPTEDKSVFDVLVQSLSQPGRLVGLSCKTRRELARVARDGHVTIELSNSSRKMWDILQEQGIDLTNYRSRPREVGTALVRLIRQWHRRAALYKGSKVDISRSSYVVLLWSPRSRRTQPQYQIYRYQLRLPNPASVRWYFTEGRTGHLNGDDTMGGRVFEWYGESGGQLKYYPLASEAAYRSVAFSLQPMPTDLANTGSIGIRAASYFPDLWQAVSNPG